MQNALFTYRRKVTVDRNGAPLETPVINENYLSPMQVTSAYWQEGDTGAVLSVFLTNGFNVTFNKTTGDKFLIHWEEYHRLLFAAPAITATAAVMQEQYTRRTPAGARNGQRPVRNIPQAVEVIEEFTDAPIWDAPTV